MSYLVPILAAVIVLGTLAIGWRDISRFRFRRVRAIAGVCFAESIRRRILWITPLAIVGIIAVSQLTRPLDEQDAVRQSTKYCLFATGLILVVAAIMLACTNLPKEIENRVIFTIVTKPTTRLEIVLGKVLGFTFVSGVILLIMGAFTLGYVEIRAWSLTKDIQKMIANGSIDAVERRKLEHYATAGLLSTKAIEWPVDLQVYGRQPAGDGVRWITGGQQTYFIAPFALTEADKQNMLTKLGDRNGLFLIATLTVDSHKLTEDEAKELKQGNHPREDEVFGPAIPSPTSQPIRYAPRISLSAAATTTNRAIATKDLPPSTVYPALGDRNWKPGGARTFVVPLSGDALKDFFDAGRFNVEVSASTPGFDFGAGPTPLALVVMDRETGAPVVSVKNSETAPVDIREHPDHEGKPTVMPPGVRFFSRFGRIGMQVTGRAPEDGLGAVAVYSFSNVQGAETRNGKVLFQTKVSVDRGGDLDADKFVNSLASLQVRNRKTNFVSDPVIFEPTTNRLVDLEVPAQSVEGGDFDVLVRGITPGQYLGFHGLTATTPSIALVSAEQSFSFNLTKSLLLLWMLSILVVAISIFCSTFLSWPIAVVLTVMLLLGRWGVVQLGEALDPGASRGVVRDLFGIRDPNKSQAASDTMEALASTLRNGSTVLPDVSQFPVMEDIDRGVSIPISRLLRALRELTLYGIPLVLITYVILLRKEVAP